MARAPRPVAPISPRRSLSTIVGRRRSWPARRARRSPPQFGHPRSFKDRAETWVCLDERPQRPREIGLLGQCVQTGFSLWSGIPAALEWVDRGRRPGGAVAGQHKIDRRIALDCHDAADTRHRRTLAALLDRASARPLGMCSLGSNVTTALKSYEEARRGARKVNAGYAGDVRDRSRPQAYRPVLRSAKVRTVWHGSSTVTPATRPARRCSMDWERGGYDHRLTASNDSRLRLKPLPGDRIREGQVLSDQSILTGESLPIEVGPGRHT